MIGGPTLCVKEDIGENSIKRVLVVTSSSPACPDITAPPRSDKILAVGSDRAVLGWPPEVESLCPTFPLASLFC
jgi:hypothetical protein